MCDKCSELDKKIERYRRVIGAINDRLAVDGITQLIKEAEAEKAKLHPLMLHRSRQLLVRQRTMLSNAIRGHLAELGIISAKGRNGTAELFKIIADEKDGRIPAAARFSLDVLARQHAAIAAEIGAIEKRIHAWHRSSEESRRLEQIPGVGPIVATAGDLEARIVCFVEHYNHSRYHESLQNLTPADVYFGRGQAIILERERIKRDTIKQRRLQHRLKAA